MEQEVSFTKKLNSIRLLLSSLFARKQDWIVFNGDEPNVFIFTTVPADRIVFYRAEIDDQMSLVKVTDEGVKYLYELFPLFKSTCGIINLTVFLKLVNKLVGETKGVAPNVRIDLKRDCYVMDLPKSSKDGFEEGLEDSASEMVVGQLIPADIYQAYKQVFAHHASFVDEVIEKNITLGGSARLDKVTSVNIELHNSLFDKDVLLRLPIQDGTNIVSFTEYLGKKKAEWKYRVLIQYNEKHSACKITYAYKDDTVDVISITPGALWFPFRKRS